MPPQRAPTAMPTRIASGRWMTIGRSKLEADPAGRAAADEHLAAATDVEQRRAEGDADAEATEDQRAGELQGLGQRAPLLGGLGDGCS